MIDNRARNLFLLVACALLAVLVMPNEAYAQQVTKNQALASCEASRAYAAGPVAQYNASGISSTVKPCRDVPSATTPGSGEWHCEYTFSGGTYGCDNWYPSAKTVHPYAITQQCNNLQPFSYSFTSPNSAYSPPPATSCLEGCEYKATETGSCIGGASGYGNSPDATCSIFGTANPTGNTCTGNDPKPDDESENKDGWKCDPTTGICLDPDGKPNYCTFNPDGSRSNCVGKAPNLPGGGDADGDGIPDADDTDSTDPDNGKDDGGGDEKDNQASGGATCSSAPSCSGDGIACNTLFQQWKTRCAAESTASKLRDGINVTTTGGDPDGDGDDPFDKAGERAAIDSASAGLAANNEGLGSTSVNDAWVDGGTGSVSTTMFGTGGGCPAFPQVMIGPVAFQRPAAFCSYVALIRALVLALGFIWAVQIVSGD